jgi:putative transcriptional regulator
MAQQVPLLTLATSATIINGMSSFKDIRVRIGATQSELADLFGCTQGNVSLYDKGQTLPTEAAKLLIALGKSRGHHVTFEDIYGPVPKLESRKQGRA